MKQDQIAAVLTPILAQFDLELEALLRPLGLLGDLTAKAPRKTRRERQKTEILSNESFSL